MVTTAPVADFGTDAPKIHTLLRSVLLHLLLRLGSLKLLLLMLVELGARGCGSGSVLCLMLLNKLLLVELQVLISRSELLILGFIWRPTLQL